MLSMTTLMDMDKIENEFPIDRYRKFSPHHEQKSESIQRANAFCVTLFCLSEKYSSRAIDFFREAFVEFSGKDFMMLTLPHQIQELGLVRYLTFIPPKAFSPSSSLPLS